MSLYEKEGCSVVKYSSKIIFLTTYFIYRVCFCIPSYAQDMLDQQSEITADQMLADHSLDELEDDELTRGTVSASLELLNNKIGNPSSIPGGTVSGSVNSLHTKVGSPAVPGDTLFDTIADVEVDTNNIITLIGNPSGVSVSADIQAVQTKLGTPTYGSVSADIADVKAAVGGTCNAEHSPFSTSSATGVFCVVDNFALTGGQVGVTVDSSNVEVDLTGHVINGQGNAGTIGVQITSVGASRTNIKIKNGTIANCVTGAVVFTGANPIENVVFEDITITGCNTSGGTIVSIAGAKKVTFKNCTVNNNGSSNALTAIDITTSSHCTFENIQVIENSGSNVIGVSVGASCTSNTFTNCAVRGHEAASVTGTFVGFSLGSNANKNVLRSCSVIDNAAGGATVTGFASSSNSRNDFIECLAHGNNSSVALTTVRGFYLVTCSYNNLFNCIASDQLSSAGTAIGFDVQSSGSPSTLCSLKECIASRNIGSNAANSMGFNQNPTSAGASGSTFNTFIKNIALANSTNATGVSDGGGQYAGLSETQVSVDGINTDLGGAWHNVGLTGSV